MTPVETRRHFVAIAETGATSFPGSRLGILLSPPSLPLRAGIVRRSLVTRGKPMKYDLSPSEHPLTDSRRDRTVRRGIPALTVLLSIAVAGYLRQGIVHHTWAWSLLGLTVSVGAAFAFWRVVASGHAPTTWGEFDRGHSPFAFWLSAALCFFLFLFSVAVMFFGQPFSTR